MGGPGAQLRRPSNGRPESRPCHRIRGRRDDEQVTIGEVADQVVMSAKAIRLYEQRGLLQPATDRDPPSGGNLRPLPGRGSPRLRGTLEPLQNVETRGTLEPLQNVETQRRGPSGTSMHRPRRPGSVPLGALCLPRTRTRVRRRPRSLWQQQRGTRGRKPQLRRLCGCQGMQGCRPLLERAGRRWRRSERPC